MDLVYVIYFVYFVYFVYFIYFILFILLSEALVTSATSDQNAENLSVPFRAPDYNHFLPVASEGGDSAVVYR